MKPDIHYHLRIDYDGFVETHPFPSFNAALDRARRELIVEKLFDRDLPRRIRRKFDRREFIQGIYAKWVGMPRSGADAGIIIEVNACTSGLHEGSVLDPVRTP